MSGRFWHHDPVHPNPDVWHTEVAGDTWTLTKTTMPDHPGWWLYGPGVDGLWMGQRITTAQLAAQRWITDVAARQAVLDRLRYGQREEVVWP